MKTLLQESEKQQFRNPEKNAITWDLFTKFFFQEPELFFTDLRTTSFRKYVNSSDLRP